MSFSIHLIPFIIGALFNMVLGALWYSPVLFVKPWMKESGVVMGNMDVSKGKMGKVYALTTTMAFVTSFVLGFLVLNLGITTIFGAILVAILVWLATNAPYIFRNWGFEGRTIKLGIINHGYDFVVYIVVCVLFVLL